MENRPIHKGLGRFPTPLMHFPLLAVVRDGFLELSWMRDGFARSGIQEVPLPELIIETQ